MRTLLLATVSALTVTAATAASAADLPTKAPPAVAAPWSWAGPYVGLSLGAGAPRTGFYDLDTLDGPLAFHAGEFSRLENWGVTVGGQAGYNWQVGNVVAGIETDINWLDGKSGATLPAAFSGGVSAGTPMSVNTNVDWFWTLRGRLGWSFSRVMIYGTGGLAVAHIANDWGAVGQLPRFSYDTTRSGWTAGGGIEYALTNNWTARIEGFYADFGTSPIQTINGFAGSYQSKFTNTLTVVRGGLNWKW